jgi:hypothetical protein
MAEPTFTQIEAGARALDPGAFMEPLCSCAQCLKSRHDGQEVARMQATEVLTAALSLPPAECTKP